MSFDRRDFLTGLGGASLATALPASPTSAQTPLTAAPGAAERILHGHVRTLDPAGTVTEAVAIAGGKIVAVGSRKDMVVLRGPATQIHELGTATIIPGFNDTHGHLEREGLKTLRPSLADAKSVADILQRVRTIARTAPPGMWIMTMPVGEPPYYFGGPAALAEKRMPTRDELDRAAPNNPVCIGAPFGYWTTQPSYTSLNSAGLKLNGIDRNTVPRFATTEIMRDDKGEPTGVIVSKNIFPTMEFELLQALPKFTFADRLEGLRRSQKLYHAVGVTSVYEGHGEASEPIAVYRRLWESGGMTMRVGLCLSPSWANAAEAERQMRDWLSFARGRGFGDPMLRIAGIFIAYGGDAKVAELARQTLPDVGWSGQVEQANTPAEFEEMCMLAARYDYRLNTLASESLREIVAILQRVDAKYPLRDRRWVLEHLGRCRIEDLQALKALGVQTTLIPTSFLWKGGARYASVADGETNLICPARQLLDLGIPVAAATDNIPYDPFFTMWVMTARQERTTGRILGADARLTNEEALRLMTVNGARLTFDEDVKGPLLPGRYADLAVLSGDPVTANATELQSIKCAATLVGGRVVHGALS